MSDAAILIWSAGSQLNNNDLVEIERSAAGDPFVRLASVEATVPSVVDPTALGCVLLQSKSGKSNWHLGLFQHCLRDGDRRG